MTERHRKNNQQTLTISHDFIHLHSSLTALSKAGFLCTRPGEIIPKEGSVLCREYLNVEEGGHGGVVGVCGGCVCVYECVEVDFLCIEGKLVRFTRVQIFSQRKYSFPKPCLP